MSINIKSLSGTISQKAQSITHSGTTISSIAKAVHNIGGPVTNHGGIAKILSSAIAAAAGAFSSFSSLTSTLSSVTTAFSSITSLGGLVGQMTSVTSSFSSLTSLAGGFSSISSLSGALSSFQGLTSGLNSLTGGSTNSGGGSSGGSSGTLNAVNTSSNTVLGGVGSIAEASNSLTALAGTASFSSVSSNLLSVANYTGSLAPAVGLVQNNQNMTAVANTVVALQNMGIQQSQPGSTTTVTQLKALMQDIYNLLSALVAPTTVTISGSTNSGDVVALTIRNSTLTGSPKTYSYTVGPSDSVGNIAAQLRALLAADAALASAGITSSVSGAVITITTTSPTAINSTVSGVQSELVAIGGGDVTQATSNSLSLDSQMAGIMANISAITTAFAGLP